MIVAIVVSFVVPSAYHLALIYVSVATMFFLVRYLSRVNIRVQFKIKSLSYEQFLDSHVESSNTARIIERFL